MAPSNTTKPKPTARDLVFGGIVQLITLPYHRFFNYNTLRPALEIEKYAGQGIDRDSHGRAKLHSLLSGWRGRKRDELGFVSVTVGCFVEECDSIS
jgi:hypothetical protein